MDLNQLNKPIEPNSLTPFRGFHTITEQRFYAWTREWYQQIANTKMLLESFRNNHQHLLKKIYFNDDTVQDLLSSTGIETICARFVIADEYAPYAITQKTFTIVLYARDNQGNRCSAYHIGKPQYNYALDFDEQEAPGSYDNDPGYISDTLAKNWINVWKEIIETDKQGFPEKLFLTDYGFLNGYNYLMSDFMHALYPPGSHVKIYNVIILLAAHRHIDHHSDQQLHVATFGLVLAGVELITSRDDPEEEQVYSYFDLSLPTPPNP